MAENKESPLDLSAGGSSAPMAGGEEFSLQPCNQVEESARKRKAPASGLNGCAPKRRGEEVVGEEEPWRAVDSQLILQEGEEGTTPGFDEFMVRLRASFAADVKKMFANSPSMMSPDFPKASDLPTADQQKFPLDPSDDGSNMPTAGGEEGDDDQAGRLAEELRNTVQGDMSVAAYCSKLKKIADQLYDIDDPVSDKNLTMQLIAGLDARFKEQRELLESMVPFPSFREAQSRLQVAEIKLTSKIKFTSKGKADPDQTRRRWRAYYE
jgi:hypothetical protein